MSTLAFKTEPGFTVEHECVETRYRLKHDGQRIGSITVQQSGARSTIKAFAACGCVDDSAFNLDCPTVSAAATFIAEHMRACATTKPRPGFNGSIAEVVDP